MYSRAISPTERLYIARSVVTPPMAIQLVVEGTGSIDRKALSEAVARAAVRCPGSRIVRRGRTWAEGGPAPAVRRVVDAVADRGFRHAALRAPFHASTGPNCEILLAGPGADRLVFRAFHAVMDGQGVLAWAANVFAALRGEPGVPALSTVTETDIVDAFPPRPRHGSLPRDCASPLARLPAAARSTGTRPSGPRPANARPADADPVNVRPASAHPVDTDPMDTDPAEPGTWLWRRRTIPGLHHALAARTIAAIAALTGEPSRFVVPVSLRRHRPELRSTANLTLPLYLDVPARTPWTAVRDRLRGALAEHRELGSGGLDPVVEHGVARTLSTGTEAVSSGPLAPCTAVVSHVGRVDPATLSTPAFTAHTVYSLPMFVTYAPVFLTAYQLPNHAEISLSCADGPGMGHRAEALLEHIRDSLLAHLDDADSADARAEV
ncbi:hypothetical protein ACIHAA_27640 [Streptomyces sp. NPDC052040]|uniref:hypothetical protein n=1 Tax=Streptomyces sp. NPDC052040 TaxID=3365682 RepID=UPI0037CD864B